MTDSNPGDHNKIDQVAKNRARIIFGHVPSDGGKASCSMDHQQTMTSATMSQSPFSASQLSSADEKVVVVPAKEVVKKKKGTWLDSLNMNPKAHWPKKYRYTVEPPPGSTPTLSIRERDHYESYGYIVIKNIIPKPSLDKLSGGVEPLNRFVTHPNVIKLAEQFTGPNLMAMKVEEWDETLFESMSPTDLIQDLFSLPFRPADRILNTLTLLPPPPPNVSSSNVPSINFIMIPGSHKTSQMMTIHDGEKIIHEVCPQIDLGLKKQVNLIPGDTIFFHPLLAHTFVKESSDGAAKAISCTFAASECEYVSMTGNEELVQRNGIRGHKVNDIQEWIRDALLIKGTRVNL